MIGMSDQSGKLASILSNDSKVEKVASGFEFVEGPVWNSQGGFLLFSDIPANRIYKWSQEKMVEVFRKPSGNSNGLTYDKEGRLIICEHGTRRVSRIEKDGSYTVLAEKFQGKRLNSPNDVVVKSDGAIYFTDPPYGIKPEQQELPFQGVFRLDPSTKKLALLVEDFPRPNGLAFSPDEKVLYVADSSTEQRHVRAFNVRSGGTLSNGRVFAETRSKKPGNPDGIKVDTEGRLYVSASGVWVFDEDGKHLGNIETREMPANLAWGDKDWKTLYITARTSLYRIRLNVAGIKVP
jgi:gluconolactonase